MRRPWAGAKRLPYFGGIQPPSSEAGTPRLLVVQPSSFPPVSLALLIAQPSPWAFAPWVARRPGPGLRAPDARGGLLAVVARECARGGADPAVQSLPPAREYDGSGPTTACEAPI